MASWGQHGTYLDPVGPRWAPCWPHELYYQGIASHASAKCLTIGTSSCLPTSTCHIIVAGNMPAVIARRCFLYGLLPDMWNCGLRMRRECRERFPRHGLQRIPRVSDPGVHNETCVTHVPWCMSGSLTRSGGENVPGACARGPWLLVWYGLHRKLVDSPRRRSAMQKFDVFLDVSRASSYKQSNCLQFEAPSRSCDVTVMCISTWSACLTTACKLRKLQNQEYLVFAHSILLQTHT